MRLKNFGKFLFSLLKTPNVFIGEKNIALEETKILGNIKCMHLMLAPSGYGKTTALRQSIHRFLHSLFQYTDTIPVYVPLYEMFKQDKPLSYYSELFTKGGVSERSDERKRWLKDICTYSGIDDKDSEEIILELLKIHNDEKRSIIYLFDGLNEVFQSRDFTQREVTDTLKVLHIFAEENHCIISSCDFSNVFLKIHDVSFNSTMRIHGILSTEIRHIRESSLAHLKNISHIPFFFGLLSEQKKKKGREVALTPYSLIENYLKLVLGSHASSQLSTLFYYSRLAYPTFHIDSSGISSLELLIERENGNDAKGNQRPRILRQNTDGQYYFYHQRYWEFIMAYGAVKSTQGGLSESETCNSYWEAYCYMSNSAFNRDAPQIYTIVKDLKLYGAIGLFLHGCEPQIARGFFSDCQTVLNNSALGNDRSDELALLSFLADFFPESPIEIVENTMFDEAINGFIYSCLSGIKNYANRENDLNTFMRLSSYLTPETKALLFDIVMRGDSLQQQEHLLDYYEGSTISTLLNASKNTERQQRIIKQCKDYLTSQFPWTVMYKSKEYNRFFGTNRSTRYFFRSRYFDNIVTCFLYTLLLSIQLWQITYRFIDGFHLEGPALNSSVLITIFIIKILSLLMSGGSAFAWIVQLMQPKDVYLKIFGDASEWVTLDDVFRLLGDGTISRNKKRRTTVEEDEPSLEGGEPFKFLTSWAREVVSTTDGCVTDGSTPEASLNRAVIIIFDWVRVRPSVVFYFTTVLSLLWLPFGQYLPAWIEAFLCCMVVSLVVFMPISSYLYISSLKNTDGVKKIIFNCQLALFWTMALFVVLSTIGEIISIFLVIFGISGIVLWLLLYYIIPIGKEVRKLQKADEEIINKCRDAKDCKEYFKELKTEGGRQTLARVEADLRATIDMAQNTKKKE